MANQINKLITKFIADTKGFKSGVTDAKSAIKSFSKLTAASAAAITGAFTGVFLAISNTAEKIDKLAKTSSKLGLLTAELQFLQFQANLSGVSSEKLNLALQRMLRRTAEAATGTGEAKNALIELGLSAKDLVKLKPEEQFQKIGEAINGVKNSSDKLRLAFKLFDSEGVEVVNAFGKDVKALREEFDQLGASLTQEQVKSVDEYSGSLTKLGLLFEGFKMQVTAALAGPLSQMIENIKEQIIQFGGLKGAAMAFADGFIGGLIIGLKGFQGLIDGIQAAILEFKRLKLIVLSTLQSLSELNFQIRGGDINFDRLQEIAKLRRDVQAGDISEGITAPLIRGLESARGALGRQATDKQEVEVKGQVEIKPNESVFLEFNQRIAKQLMAREAASIGAND